MIVEGQKLWEPSAAFVESSNMTALMRWLGERQHLQCKNYKELWQWSVTQPEAFWAAMWDYFEVISDTPYERVLSDRQIRPGVRWFEGSRVNFAEHILRHKGSHAAISAMAETRDLEVTSWDELASQVRRVATKLREWGIRPGDRVSAVMPNRPETVVAMLAVISIGGVWSNAAPEFGTQAILDRLGQVEPRLVFFGDGYEFGGKRFDRTAMLSELLAALPSVERVVRLDVLGDCPAFTADAEVSDWPGLMAAADPASR